MILVWRMCESCGRKFSQPWLTDSPIPLVGNCPSCNGHPVYEPEEAD